jgi:hypothetical protein
MTKTTKTLALLGAVSLLFVSCVGPKVSTTSSTIKYAVATGSSQLSSIPHVIKMVPLVGEFTTVGMNRAIDTDSVVAPAGQEEAMKAQLKLNLYNKMLEDNDAHILLDTLWNVKSYTSGTVVQKITTVTAHGKTTTTPSTETLSNGTTIVVMLKAFPAKYKEFRPMEQKDMVWFFQSFVETPPNIVKVPDIVNSFEETTSTR